MRDERIRNSKMESQIESIIERDLRLIYETTLPYTTLRRVLAELAANTGKPLNLSYIQRQTSVSINTLRKLISAFNAMYLIELVPSNQKSSQDILYFVDAGEANYLAQGRLSPSQINSQVLYSNINSSMSSLWDSKIGVIQTTNFRTRGGTNIPLVLNTNLGCMGFCQYLMVYVWIPS